jgi:hypothetical protein
MARQNTDHGTGEDIRRSSKLDLREQGLANIFCIWSLFSIARESGAPHNTLRSSSSSGGYLAFHTSANLKESLPNRSKNEQYLGLKQEKGSRFSIEQ